MRKKNLRKADFVLLLSCNGELRELGIEFSDDSTSSCL